MPEHASPSLALVAIGVGNTNTHLALFDGPKTIRRASAPSAGPDAVADAAASLAGEAGAVRRRAVVMASVNAPACEAIERAIRARLADAPDAWSVYLIGRDLDIPMRGRLDPESVTGHDRVLAALAAYDAMKQACIVVDAGTALTVDFVDGEGVYHGGAIAPGLELSLRALHEHTAALPEVHFHRPNPGAAFGRNTADAMTNGVFFAARGLVRALAERYAEAYGAYPPIVATGGDAHTVFDDDELVDRVVDDLVLRGIAVACRKALAPAEADVNDD